MQNTPHLSADDQARLASALDRLLAEGLLWRDDERDLRAYHALARWRDLAAGQLGAKGWELHHHDAAHAFHVVHHKGRHKLALKRETALCLLVVRLLYAETPATLTRYPIVSLAEVSRRCDNFSFHLDPAEALPELAALKLIRAAGGGPPIASMEGRPLRLADPDQLIELLPTLEVAVPDHAISTLAQSLAVS